MVPARGRIVAAVAGQDTRALVDFVSEEALRTGADLHFVHVPQLAPGLSGPFDVDWEAARAFGHHVLARASADAHELVGGRITITHELVAESRGTVTDIVARSEGARLVALQHRRLTGIGRAVGTSTTQGVASRSHAPVVSVPASWQPENRHHTVVVAVHDPAGADHTLRTAFTLAGQRQDRLRVLHACLPCDGHGDEGVRRDAVREDRFRNALAAQVQALRAEFSDVRVEIEVRHEPIGSALLRGAEHGDLLVLGRRHPRLPLAAHLGPVSRLALETSTIPVMFVETVAPVPVPGQRVETTTSPGQTRR
ncbi:universal stress protein [Nocardioides sp. Soil796]|uniref:universal stress protein n=1 Tax=Nocardioides sp. Soil796 TaxID=1736412 RepID=UPI002285A97B|nr:universal stress protein [Nocardioides sp. Soil796]